MNNPTSREITYRNTLAEYGRKLDQDAYPKHNPDTMNRAYDRATRLVGTIGHEHAYYALNLVVRELIVSHGKACDAAYDNGQTDDTSHLEYLNDTITAYDRAADIAYQLVQQDN